MPEELGVEMTPEQRRTLEQLSRELPTFEDVLAGLPQTGDTFFRYYYPLCFRYTAEFFTDPNDAENATLPLFEHWTSAVEKYDQDKAKLATYFHRVAKNFCLNYQRDISYGPELVFQSEENEVDEDESSPVSDVAFAGDYPTDGVDNDDPETLYLKKEAEEEQDYRAREIRAQLYPGDQQVFDLLLENYNAADIASILERTELSVENAMRRIREVTGRTSA